MESQRDTTIGKLIQDASHNLSDAAAWPESEAAQREAKTAIKLLRKTFKSDNYPRLFMHLAAMKIAGDVIGDAAYRKFSNEGMKGAWLLLAELYE